MNKLTALLLLAGLLTVIQCSFRIGVPECLYSDAGCSPEIHPIVIFWPFITLLGLILFVVGMLKLLIFDKPYDKKTEGNQ